MLFDDWKTLSSPVIRPATPSDVRTIARIHVAGWRSTYQSILPDDVLDNLSYAEHERLWMRLIAGGDSGPYVLVSEHPVGGVVGFIASGPERSDTPGYAGEVYALYVDEQYQHSGIGRSLLQYVAQIMSENAQQGLLLWAFAESPSNTMFQRLGAQEVARRTRTYSDTQIEEVALGWPDIRRLLDTDLKDEGDHGESEDDND
jgi:ribosomal protein S18 acetylase RimI-like enzyme